MSCEQNSVTQLEIQHLVSRTHRSERCKRTNKCTLPCQKGAHRLRTIIRPEMAEKSVTKEDEALVDILNFEQREILRQRSRALLRPCPSAPPDNSIKFKVTAFGVRAFGFLPETETRHRMRTRSHETQCILPTGFS